MATIIKRNSTTTTTNTTPSPLLRSVGYGLRGIRTVSDVVRQTINITIDEYGRVTNSNFSLGNRGDNLVTYLDFNIASVIQVEKLENYDVRLFIYNPRLNKSNLNPIKVEPQDGYTSDLVRFILESNWFSNAGTYELIFGLIETTPEDGNVDRNPEVFLSDVMKANLVDTGIHGDFVEQLIPEALPVDADNNFDEFIQKPHLTAQLENNALNIVGISNVNQWDAYTTYIQLEGFSPLLKYFYLIYNMPSVNNTAYGSVRFIEENGENGTTYKTWLPKSWTTAETKVRAWVVGTDLEITQSMIGDGSWRQAKVYVTNPFDFQTKTNFLDEENWTTTLLESGDLKLLDKEENDILVVPDNIVGTYQLNYTGSEVDDLLAYANQLKTEGSDGKAIVEVDELPLLEDKPESCYIYSPLGINILNPYAQIRILTLDELPDLSQTFTDNELQDNNIGIGCYTNSILYYFDYISKNWWNINTLYGFKGYIDNISEGSFNLDGDDSIDSFYVVKVAKKVKEEYDDNKLYKIKETRCSIVYNYPRFIIEELMYKSMFEIIPCKNLPTIGKPVMNYMDIITGGEESLTAYYEESSKELKVYIPQIIAESTELETGWFDAFALMSTSELDVKGIIYDRNELVNKEEGAYVLVETENNIYEIDNVNKIYNRLNGNNIVNIPANLESTILVLDDEQVKKIKYGTNVELNTTMIRPFTLSDSLFEQGRKVFSCSYLDFYNYETLNTTFINVDLILGLASVQFHQTTTPKLTLMRDRLGIGTEPELGMGISPYSHVPIDQTPTNNSINLINSGGVKAYIDSQIGSINTILDEILGEGE